MSKEPNNKLKRTTSEANNTVQHRIYPKDRFVQDLKWKFKWHNKSSKTACYITQFCCLSNCYPESIPNNFEDKSHNPIQLRRFTKSIMQFSWQNWKLLFKRWHIYLTHLFPKSLKIFRASCLTKFCTIVPLFSSENITIKMFMTNLPMHLTTIRLNVYCNQKNEALAYLWTIKDSTNPTRECRACSCI